MLIWPGVKVNVKNITQPKAEKQIKIKNQPPSVGNHLCIKAIIYN